MNTENIIRALAGSLVLLSLALARLVHPYFLLLAAFVGLNLLQSAFTGLCPAESIIRRLRKAPASAPCCPKDPAP